MTDLDGIARRLDRIIELLELQTFVPEDAVPVCPHEHAVDIGTMGMKVGELMLCNDCGEKFTRVHP